MQLLVFETPQPFLESVGKSVGFDSSEPTRLSCARTFAKDVLQSRTSSGTTAASEVFPNFPTTNAALKLVANLMFHEAMHNKLGYNDPQLHNRGGLASGSPQAAPITDATQLTASNISLLAAHLDDSPPQWTAGIGLLTTPANVPDSDQTNKGLF